MENEKISKNAETVEKYRATKLWNELIRTFRTQLPLKPHRRNLKNYEDTFTGSEAIDWLHGYLCAKAEIPNKVNRVQTLILLKKFHQHGLFSEAIKNDKTLPTDGIVRDDGTLYKTPLALKNFKSRRISSENDLAGTVKPLSYRQLSESETEQKKLVVKQVTEDESLNPTSQDLNIFMPLPKLSLYTKRLNSEEIEDLWKLTTISRLQQILRWDSLQSVIEAKCINAKHIHHNAHHFTTHGVTKVFTKQDDLPHWTLQAMKCLANWPWKNGILNWPAYENFEKDVLTTIVDFYNNQATPLIPNEYRELFISVLDRVECLDLHEWDNSCYPIDDIAPEYSNELRKIETEFGISVEESPISRIKSNDSCIMSRSFSERSASTKKCLFNPKSRASYALSSFRNCGQSLEEVLNGLPGLIRSPKLLRSLKNTPLPGLIRPNPQVCSSTATVPKFSLPRSRFSVASNNFDISSCEYNPQVAHTGSCITFFTQRGRELACEAFQTCLLLLPPRNRRWLQLLLRMMNKISNNPCLRLDKCLAIANRKFVLELFADCLLLRDQSFTRQQSIKLLTFLLDAQNELFSEPKHLQIFVNDRIENAEKEKLSLPACSTESMTFCERILPTFYESQTVNASRKALLDLMDSIINDNKISSAVKRKRLKKFEKAYPDLFLQKFPTKLSFNAQFPPDKRSKFGESLAKLRSLRI